MGIFGDDDDDKKPGKASDLLNGMFKVDKGDINVEEKASGNLFGGLTNTLNDMIKLMAPGAKQAGFAAAQAGMTGATSTTASGLVGGSLSASAGAVEGMIGPGVLSSTLNLAAGLAPPLMAAGDALTDMQKTLSPVILGTMKFQDVIKSGSPILSGWQRDIFAISAATGLMPDEIARSASEILKSGTQIATGLNTTLNPLEANQLAFRQLGESMIVARNIGISNQAMTEAATNAYRNQGLTIGQTTQMTALLKEGIAGTGTSIDVILPMMNKLQESFKYTGMNVGLTAAGMGNAAAMSKQLREEGVNTFHSTEQAVKTHTTALEGANETLKDYGSAMLYASLSGGGEAEAFEMQFGDMSPEEKEKKITSGLQQMYTGGQELTYESAKATGQLSGYAMYVKAMDKELKIGDTQQTSKYLSLKKRMNEGDKTAEPEMKKILSTVGPKGELSGDSAGAAIMSSMLQQDQNFYAPMLQTTKEISQKMFAPVQEKVAGAGQSFNQALMGVAEPVVKSIISTMGTAANAVGDTVDNFKKNFNIEELEKAFKAGGLGNLTTEMNKQLGTMIQQGKKEGKPLNDGQIETLKKAQEEIGKTKTPTTSSNFGGTKPSGASLALPAPTPTTGALAPAPTTGALTPAPTAGAGIASTTKIQQAAGEVANTAYMNPSGDSLAQVAEKLNIKMPPDQMTQMLNAASAILEAKKQDSSILNPQSAPGSRHGTGGGSFSSVLTSASMNADPKDKTQGSILSLAKLNAAQSEGALTSNETSTTLTAAKSAQKTVASASSSPITSVNKTATPQPAAPVTQAASNSSPSPSVYNGTIVVQIDGKAVFKAIKNDITANFQKQPPSKTATG